MREGLNPLRRLALASVWYIDLGLASQASSSRKRPGCNVGQCAPMGGGRQPAPEVCRRPCVHLAKGACHSGSACGYCHSPEHRRAIPDKRDRQALGAMCEAQLLDLIIPHLRRLTESLGRSGILTQNTATRRHIFFGILEEKGSQREVGGIWP